jgi:hypothetical protein
MWVQVCEQCLALFKRVMPMVMENLVITQYRYLLWYVTIYGYGQCSNVWTWTLYLFVIENIYHIVWDNRLCHSMHEEVLFFGILLLEGQDGQIWKDYVWNCVPYHLSHVYGQVDPSLAIVLVGLWCMLCGELSSVIIMLVCDHCSKR